MGSEDSWSKIDEATSFQPSEPTLCANGCGFFGSAATMNLCSKCYRDLSIKEEQEASAKAAVIKLVQENQTPVVDGEDVEGSSSSPPVATGAVDEAAAKEKEKQEEKVKPSRCGGCKKKVGLLGFKCRCGKTFCGTHRYPEKHDCTFDFKTVGRDAIAEANPVVKADKLQRI